MRECHAHPTLDVERRSLGVRSGMISHKSFIRNKAVYTATQSRAGGQGPYLRSVEHLGRSRKAKNPMDAEKVKCDGGTDGRMYGRTDGST